MKVDVESSSIAGEIEIAAPPEAVFQALTDPEQLAAWWGDDALYRTFNWNLDLRPGGVWSCEAKGVDGKLGSVHGEFVEVDPPRVLAYTWNPSWDPSIGATNVRYTLTPIASGTLLSILHDGFGSHMESLQGHAQGWTRVLGWLSQYVAGKA